MSDSPAYFQPYLLTIILQKSRQKLQTDHLANRFRCKECNEERNLHTEAGISISSLCKYTSKNIPFYQILSPKTIGFIEKILNICMYISAGMDEQQSKWLSPSFQNRKDWEG